jgi:putative salt-induced outer membrane protein
MTRKFFPLIVLAVVGYGVGALWGEEAGSKWTSSVGLGLTKTSGNSDVTNLALTAQAVDEMVKGKWSTNVNLTYARNDGDETANKGGILTELDYPQGDRLFYFGKVGFEFDKFADLDLRTSPGGGLGYIIVHADGVKLSATIGANAVTDFFSNNTRDTRGTLSWTEEFAYDLTSTANLTHNFNIQNNFKDFGDYLLSTELSLSTKVSDHLSLKASLLDKYDSTPFSADLKKNDLTFITALNYAL